MRYPPRSHGGVIAIYVAAFPVLAACIAASFLALRWFFSLNGGVPFDIAPLSSFLNLRVVNDTSASVKIEPCPNLHCQASGRDLVDSLAPGRSRQEAAWPNDLAGVAVVRVTQPSGAVIGCLRLPYRKGQKNAQILVSAASPC